MACCCALCPCSGKKEESVIPGGCDYCSAHDLSGVFTPHTCADEEMLDAAEAEMGAAGRP